MKRNFHNVWLLLIFLAAAIISCYGNDTTMLKTAPYTEKERQQEYIKRGHSWPLVTKDYVPNTTGWMKLMQKRFQQVGAMTDMQEKWWGWTTLMGPATQIVTNYTALGWGLTKGPVDLTTKLQDAIHQGLPHARQEKNLKGAIDGPNPPLFIDDKNNDLLQLVSKIVQPILEAWTGIKLVPSITYGFRLYQ